MLCYQSLSVKNFGERFLNAEAQRRREKRRELKLALALFHRRGAEKNAES